MRLQICLETCLSSRFMAIGCYGLGWLTLCHLKIRVVGEGPGANPTDAVLFWWKVETDLSLDTSFFFMVMGFVTRFSTLMWVLGAVMGSGNTPTSNHKEGGVPCRDSTTWTWLKETPGVWIQVGTRYVPGCWDGGLPLPLQQACCNEMTPRWSGHSRNTGGAGCPTQFCPKVRRATCFWISEA